MKTFILIATLAIGAYALNLELDESQPPESRIVNGIEASTTDLPYQVGLYIPSLDGQSSFKCGGALISERTVLTAAHCYGPNTVKRGLANLGSNRYGKGTVVVYSRVTVHERFATEQPQYDVALAHLDKVVRPNGSTIKIIALNRGHVAENTRVTVSGYGLIANGVGTDKLYYTEMIIRDKSQCRFNVPLADSMLCAKGENGKETCAGDSGGPVVVNWPNNPTHIGLVSFGAGCQTSGQKVFTRTENYIDWIESHMQ